MSTTRFQRIEAIFQDARRADGDERAAILARECAGDDALRAEVESLLAMNEGSDTFLHTPALGASFQMSTAGFPERIGPYRVLELIGEGGMGVVYAAEQDHPRRRVAVKLIRSGFMTPRHVSRFEHEAEVLGRLRHPGVAQVYAAGLHDDGRGATPYIAMEFVEGSTLDRWLADDAHTTDERLEVIARICDAVQHAHQKGVIHRDLKPRNIIVDESATQPQPKVLDFGVARVVDADAHTAVRTATGQLVGTLQYMSPEQVTDDHTAIDVRSDVYALGVILYETLVGRLPYDVRDTAVHEAARIICEDEPRLPSSLDRTLRGDVETVLRMALEKDRDRRYQSAADLGDDIRRLIRGDVVTAHPPSAMYQLRKFARRNRQLVAGGALAIVLLIAGVTVSTIGWLAASTARDQADEARITAETQLEIVRSLVEGLIFDVDAELQFRAGTLPARQAMVVTTVEHLRRLEELSSDDPRILASLGSMYSKLGDIQAGLTGPNIGDTEGALDSYTRARAALERLWELGDQGGPHAIVLIDLRLGDTQRQMGRYDEALVSLERAAEIVPEIYDDTIRATQAMVVNQRMASVLHGLGRNQEAMERLIPALDAAVVALDADPDNWERHHDLAVAHHQIGHAHKSLGDAESGLASFLASLDAFHAALDLSPGNSVIVLDVLSARDRLATTLVGLGRPDEAREHRHAALARIEVWADTNPNDAPARFALARERIKMGELHLADGDLGSARSLFMTAFDLTKQLVDADPSNSAKRRQHGVAHYKFGEVAQVTATDESQPLDVRIAAWRETREWISQTRDAFIAMRDDGLLGANDASIPDLMLAEMTSCDEAIAALEAGSSD